MDLNRASLTLPKKMKKPSPDTISLIDSTSSMESLSTAGLLGSKQLSSSLLNINEGGGTCTCQVLLGYFLIVLIKITFITNFNNVFFKHRCLRVSFLLPGWNKMSEIFFTLCRPGYRLLGQIQEGAFDPLNEKEKTETL